MVSSIDPGIDQGIDPDLLPLPPFERPTHLTGEMKLLYELLEHQHAEMMLVLRDIRAAIWDSSMGIKTDAKAR